MDTFLYASVSMVAVTLEGSVMFRVSMIASMAFLVSNMRSNVVVSAVAPVTPFKPLRAQHETETRGGG